MSDALADKRKIRILNVIDDFNREALAIEAGLAFSYSVPEGLIPRPDRTTLCTCKSYPGYTQRFYRLVIHCLVALLNSAALTWF